MPYDKYDRYGRTKYDHDISAELFALSIVLFFVLIPIIVVVCLLS
jgi:hypothetical protein